MRSPASQPERSPHDEKPGITTREEPPLPKTRESPRSNQDPAQPKIKKENVRGKNRKRCFTSLIIREIQIKTSMRSHFTLPGMATTTKQEITGEGEDADVEKPEACTLLVGT